MKCAWLLIWAASAVLAGCEKSLHQMYDQPKFKPLTPSTLFEDGNASRPEVPGTVAHSAGPLAGASSGRAGLEPRVDGAPPVADGTGYRNPLPITLALLTRGRERYDIFCAPCHSPAGDGDGMVARRGFPAPPSYHIERLRRLPDSHLYEVITQGYGVMYPYADRLSAEDRWAIVAYIRALQLSQSAPVGSLDAEDLARLNGGVR